MRHFNFIKTIDSECALQFNSKLSTSTGPKKTFRHIYISLNPQLRHGRCVEAFSFLTSSTCDDFKTNEGFFSVGMNITNCNSFRFRQEFFADDMHINNTCPNSHVYKSNQSDCGWPTRAALKSETSRLSSVCIWTTFWTGSINDGTSIQTTR